MWWNDRCCTRSVRDDLLVGLDCVWEIDRTRSYSQMQDAVIKKSYNVYQSWKIPKFTWTNVIKFDCFFGIFLTLLFARINFCHFWPMGSCFRLRQCAITICGTFWVHGIYENKWGIGINFTFWEALSQTASDIREHFLDALHKSFTYNKNKRGPKI